MSCATDLNSQSFKLYFKCTSRLYWLTYLEASGQVDSRERSDVSPKGPSVLQRLAPIRPHLDVDLEFLAWHEDSVRCVSRDRLLRHVARRTCLALWKMLPYSLRRELLRDVRHHLLIDDLAHKVA